MIKMNFYLRNRQEFRVKHSIEDPALIKQLIYILEEVSIIVDDEGSEFCFSMSSKISFSDVENIFEIVTSLIERFSLRFFPAILDWSSLSSNILTSLGISQNELRLLNSLLARDDFGSKLLENLLTIDLPNTSQRSPAPYNLSENICKFVSSSQRIFFPSTAKRVRFLSELFLSAFPEHFDGNTLHKRRFSIELNHNQAFRVLGHVLFQIRTFESTSSSISDMLCGGDQDIWINHIVPSLNLLKSTDLSIRRFCRIIIDSQFDDSFSERYKNHLTPNIMTNLEKADSPITPSSEMVKDFLF